MEVHATLRTKVQVDPIDVLINLKERVIGRNGWVFQKDGKYYRGFETGGGTHSWDSEVEIEKEEHDYVVNLQNIIEYVQQNVER